MTSDPGYPAGLPENQVRLIIKGQEYGGWKKINIEAGIERLEQTAQVRVIGGVAVESIDAWVLACCDDPKAEGHKQPKAVLHAVHGIGTCDRKVARVREKDLTKLPKTAKSLTAWLRKAREVAQARVS